MKPRFLYVLAPLAAVFALSAADCASVVEPPEYDFEPAQVEQVWAFVTRDAGGRLMQAKVIMKGCTQPQCTGATLTSVPPFEWGTPFGNCTLRWHISGQVSGDLVSFTLNGSDCETTVQGRSGTDGRLNGRFPAATGMQTEYPMSWNGFSTLFSGNGQPQPFSGSGTWFAFRCGGAIACEFPVP